MTQLRFKKMKGRKRTTSRGHSSVSKNASKPSARKCALCGTKLHGVPNKSPGDLTKLAKTEKRPERVFGGVLCSGCVTRVLIEKTRLASKVITREDVPLYRLKFIDMLK
ncbi:MAG: 50S ribosomal protein L34e [Candidatus Micrarchaeota archaeon]